MPDALQTHGHWHGSEAGRFYAINETGAVIVVTEIEKSGKLVKGRKEYECVSCGQPILPKEEHWKGSSERCHTKCRRPMRDPDVGDCREQDWFPSRSAVGGVFAKVGLEDARGSRIALWARDNRGLPDESDADYAARVKESATADWTAATEEGTAIHTAVWEHLETGRWPEPVDNKPDLAWQAKVKACESVAAWIRATFPAVTLPQTNVLKTEVAGVCRDHGVGLTLDLLIRDATLLACADLKTVPTLDGFSFGEFDPVEGRWHGKNYRVPGWAGQVGGYNEFLNKWNDTVLNGVPMEWRRLDREWYQLVVGRDTGQLMVHKWSKGELAWGWRLTDLGRQAWFHRNGYTPKTVRGLVIGTPSEAELNEMVKYARKIEKEAR